MTYLAVAYGVAWAALFGYVAYVGRLQRQLEAELAVLRRSEAGQG